jgi:hypothetical protein
VATGKTIKNGKTVYFLQIKSLVLLGRENDLAFWEVVYENGVVVEVSFPVTTTKSEVAAALRKKYAGPVK